MPVYLDLQPVRCALFALVALCAGAALQDESCPGVCECSEWKTHTISCFDIDALPKFPASTETV